VGVKKLRRGMKEHAQDEVKNRGPGPAHPNKLFATTSVVVCPTTEWVAAMGAWLLPYHTARLRDDAYKGIELVMGVKL
jgi:hypothetical protein